MPPVPTTSPTTLPPPTQDVLSESGLEGLDQAIRQNREIQDYETQVNAAQAYTHKQIVQRAAAWTS